MGVTPRDAAFPKPKESKSFFSEEKKQKTFIPKASSAHNCVGTPTKMPLQTKALGPFDPANRFD
jgi:hypothetical protein